MIFHGPSKDARLIKLGASSLIILAIAATTSLVLLNHSALAAQLNTWKLIPQPERFTELYFSDSQLPASLAPSTPATIRFTVHSHEHQITTYHYQIATRESTAKLAQIADQGDLTLAANQLKTITQTFTVPQFTTKLMVQVTLRHPNTTSRPDVQQSIHFWASPQQPSQEESL